MDIKKSIKKQTKEKGINCSIDLEHIEDVFTNKSFYRAMKKVPIIEKKVLYLIAVEEYLPDEVAYLLNLKTRQVKKLKRKAIKHFKKNLKQGERK